MNRLSSSNLPFTSIAIRNKNRDMLKLLVENGVSVHYINPNGVSMLVEAAQYGCVGIVEYLCENKVNVNFQTLHFRNTALMKSVINEDMQVTSILLRYDANPTLRNYGLFYFIILFLFLFLFYFLFYCILFIFYLFFYFIFYLEQESCFDLANKGDLVFDSWFNSLARVWNTANHFKFPEGMKKVKIILI